MTMRGSTRGCADELFWPGPRRCQPAPRCRAWRRSAQRVGRRCADSSDRAAANCSSPRRARPASSAPTAPGCATSTSRCPARPPGSRAPCFPTAAASSFSAWSRAATGRAGRSRSTTRRRRRISGLYDLDDGSLDEICNRDRLAPFDTPALLVGDDRILVQVVRNKVGQIFSVRLDGSDAREFTRAGEGLAVWLQLEPRRPARRLSPGQSAGLSGLDQRRRRREPRASGRGDPDHLYFGTSWSPDGQWILYVDCHYQERSGSRLGRRVHRPGRRQRASRADHRPGRCGSPRRTATRRTRGGGSNLPAWTRDGCILFPRRSPDSKVAWEYQAGRPDVDHFNRDYKPELARGGTEICRLDPRDGSEVALTHSDPPVWDFRASESPDGSRIVFCRAATGAAPAVWVMDADGGAAHEITRGVDDRGADHPRWLP